MPSPPRKHSSESSSSQRSKPSEFKRKRIDRGKTRPYRWIYEGKILIRKRDS